MIFKANGKEYPLIEGLRDKIKPNWQEMLKPAKEREFTLQVEGFLPFVLQAEKELNFFGETLVNKDILEVGCGYGQRAYLMAKYHGTRVHGIDVDEYVVNQSPDLNTWNPKDISFVHDKLNEVRNGLKDKFPKCVSDKVTFETCGMEQYATPNPHDLIISWDVLEHIIELPMAFNQMAQSLKKGGIAYHEYNSFFSLNGGHSLCTLDFLYGHCVLSAKDFERYIREVRPEEEKIDLNFYHKCLNRFTRSEIKELAIKNGFEILKFDGISSFGEDSEIYRENLSGEVLETVKLHYPKVTVDDLMCNSLHLILRKI